MALKKRSHFPFWHLLAGLLGLTGVAAVAVGLGIHALLDEELGRKVLLVGGGMAVPALLLLLVGVLRLAFSRRGAVGTNVAVQVLLATALLVGVNLYSFEHHKRWDLTWDETFTIKQGLRDQLARLRGETTIVMHLRHVTFGQTKEYKRDNYDAAAERKVLEKVKDLAEQFQELGPKFKVEILDVQEDDYEKRLAAVTAKAPELRAAIDRSVENAVFFSAGGNVQSLSFNQIYQLDKKAAHDADDGKGNLVLRPQGEEPFARRILNIEEKKPRLTVAVFDGQLGLESDNPILDLRGVKKALATHGFDVDDVILKKFSEFSDQPEPVALKYGEFRYEQLEEEIAALDEAIKAQQEVVGKLKERHKFWDETPLEKLRKQFVGVLETRFEIRLIDNPAEKEKFEKVKDRLAQQGVKLGVLQERHRAMFVNDIKEDLDEEEGTLKRMDAAKTKRQGEMSGLNIENLGEQRRIIDVKAKMQRLLADVDLLIVPRFTIYKLTRGGVLPNWLHGLDRDQAEAVKEFMKVGKPVLFCFGPTNDEPGQRPPPGPPDRLEPLLKEMGFTLPNQTVLYNVESQALAERRPGFLALPPDVKVPPASFDWLTGAGLPRTKKAVKGRPPHPIRTSMRMATHGLEQDLDLRLRYPRPVYYEPLEGVEPKTDPVFMMSGGESWNEEKPFPTGEKPPRFEAPKAGDPERGTVREKRRGPFPIGVAAEVRVPESWYPDEEKAKGRPTVRVAVIGHGGLFTGESLSPVREKLLLDVTNWLLGRDDQLAHDTERWEYPRVQLSSAETSLWRWGAMLGMPLLFVYLGCAMWMVRRMR